MNCEIHKFPFLLNRDCGGVFFFRWGLFTVDVNLLVKLKGPANRMAFPAIEYKANPPIRDKRGQRPSRQNGLFFACFREKQKVAGWSFFVFKGGKNGEKRKQRRKLRQSVAVLPNDLSNSACQIG